MTYLDDGADSDTESCMKTVTLSGGPGQDHHHTISLDVDKVSALLSPIMSAAGGGKQIKSPSPPTTSFFKFLKDGALLPVRNRSLFAAVFALTVASTSLLVAFDDLAVQPRLEKVLTDVALVLARNNDADAAGSLVDDDVARQLHRGLVRDAWSLAWACAAYLLLDAAASAAVWIVTLFAAVAAYSGDTAARSFRAVLGRARAQAKGPALTVAYAYALELAYEVVLMAAAAAFAALFARRYPEVLLLVALLLLAAAAVFFVYFYFLCALSVVVAVAEPGRRGAGAFARAWRLLRGRTCRFALFVAVVAALSVAASRVRALAGRSAATSMPAGWLLQRFLYAVLTAAVELFVACAITAFYYECKESSDDAETAEFVKLASEEPIDA